ERAQAQAWAASARTAIITAAQDWPAAHNQRYGLSEWAPPPEGGQWTLWYICNRHGVYLQYQGPGRNVCPVDGQNWTGWPYDQVIYTRRHSESASAARDNGLAYRLTGNADFARAAARILLAYADAYSTYPIKDTNNRPDARSGARVTAQTLDESGWLIPMAWAYDLIAGSGALDAAQRARIERDLLRAAAAVIARNNAGKSNWQSWHNAAFGAVGFALEDAALIDQAIDGPGGFRYQMRESIFSDGLWYEGAWGYHFYALDPLCQLAEMAARGGIDLWAERPLRRMFEGPLLVALPDGTLPNLNDSGNVSLYSYDRLYEMAYERYGDPLFASVLGRRARGREALFWGAESLPDAVPPPLASAVFEDSGNAVLRVAGNDHYVALKFGPHGGGHGHYDKLNFISFARGGIMAVDPGTQSYAASTHNTWDKVTVAHNTVVVDERTQAEATGRLLAFAALPAVSAVRADAGPAYRQAGLERALLLTPEYILDDFRARSTDGAAHRFDWVYHNYGAASTALPLEPYTAFPSANGYQHLGDARGAVTAGDWQVAFDMNQLAGRTYGSTWPSVSAIKAGFEYSREQAASGSFSGKMSYDFSAAAGYILFQTPPLAGQPREVPLRLRVMIHGDGSGNRLALRLYDITDERFVYTVGPVNWRGWREITASDPARWSHYLGNNDGVFDTPVKTAAVELTHVAGGPAESALHIDDIALEFPEAGWVEVTGFEILLRGLRLWMLGAPETTVVTGNGLGPNILVPVPFAMARRRGTEARFVALFEPYGEAPSVTAFRALPDGWFQVSAAGFDDRVQLDAGGALRFVRRANGALRRLGLAGDTRLEAGGQVLLELPAPLPVEVDYSEDGSSLAITVGSEWTGELRVLAPAAREITLNGAPVKFRREGEYCLL
ncbi:MAG: heparinase II/III family protein, partial [Acidobacteriota bacterium]